MRASDSSERSLPFMRKKVKRSKQKSMFWNMLRKNERPGSALRTVRQHNKFIEENCAMKQIGVAIVGTGWCGGIPAEACAAHPLVKSPYLAEIPPQRLAEVARATGARQAVADHPQLLEIDEIEAGVGSGTPR